MTTCFLEVGQRRMEHLLELASDIGIDGGVDVLLNGFACNAGLDKDISIIVIAEPGTIVTITFAERPEKTVVEMTLFRHIPADAGNLADGGVCTDLERA